MTRETQILVLGLGNPLMGDDGAGGAIIESLRRERLPSSVKIVESLSPGIHFLPDLRNCDLAILIDEVSSGVEPGTVFRFPLEQTGLAQKPAHHSHGLGVSFLITAAHLTGCFPEVLVFGIEIGCVEINAFQLSPAVRSSAERVRKLVLAEITNRSALVVDRTRPSN
jgi:hydrogenase maturation protease